MKRFIILIILLTSQNLFSGALTQAEKFIVKNFNTIISKDIIKEFGEDSIKYIKKYGDDAKKFFKATGKYGVEILTKYNDKRIIDLYKKYGDDALKILYDSKKINLFLKYGDDAAVQLMRFPAVSEEIISKYGKTGIKALEKVKTVEQAQKLGILLNKSNKKLAKKILEIVAKFGEKGLNFLWKYKKELVFVAILYHLFFHPITFVKSILPLFEEILKYIDWTKIIIFLICIYIVKRILFWLWEKFISLIKKPKRKKVEVN